MKVKVKGLIVNEQNKVRYFIVKYHYNLAVHNVSDMKKQLGFFDCEGVQLKEGVLSLTESFPKYRIEGLEKVEEVMNILEGNIELKKQLAGIDEQSAVISLSLSDDSISVMKSFRDDEFFTDYDYEESGYNDAQFIGWNTIPEIVASYLNGISKERISCSGGEKLWYSVDVSCDDFAKLTRIA